MFWFALLTASASEEPTPTAKVIEMVSSWYGDKFRGRLTASGLVFNPDVPSAAHKTLPFGTMLRVTNPDTGRSIDVRVTDRGPYIKGRQLDLSAAAAQAIGMVHHGVAKVKVEVLEIGKPGKRWPFLRET